MSGVLSRGVGPVPLVPPRALPWGGGALDRTGLGGTEFDGTGFDGTGL